MIQKPGLTTTALSRKSLEWNALWDASGDAMPLSRHECLESMAELFDSGTMRLVCQADSDGLIAAVPMVRVRRANLVSVWRLPNNPWVQGGALLTDRSRATAATYSSLAERLKSLPGGLICFDWLYETSDVQKLIAALRSRNCFVTRIPQFETGLVNVGGDWEEYLASRSSGFRKKIRRAIRKIEKSGELEFERFSQFAGDGDLERLLDEAFGMEQRSWKGENRTSVASHPEIRKLYLDLFRQCAATGTLDIQFLKIGGRRIAFEIGFVSHETYYSWKVSYDPEFEEYSPGQLLMYFQLRHWFHSGEVRTVDTVGILSEATRKWCNETRTRYRYIISTGGPLANIAVRGLVFARRWAKKILRR